MSTEGVSTSRAAAAIWVISAAIVLMFGGCLFFGSVDIPPSAVIDILTGGDGGKRSWEVIVTGARLPMACTALISGAALAVAGLLMQTTFDNPLAGPSILGVSTGSSLGVAVVMLALGGSVGTIGHYFSVLLGAIAGAMVVLVVLLLFSRFIHSSVMLLIVGIMVGYLASSAVSLLNFFSTQEGVHSFVIWGLGSFSGVNLERLPVFAVVTLAVLLLSFLMVKPLDALLLGERYAANLGVNIRATRNRLLLLSGLLTAAVTAFCGPIGFIGLIVPHVARMAVNTSRHIYLLPATAMTGSAIALFCSLVSVLPGSWGVIPVNAITPIIGVPVILYIILRRK